MTVLIPRRLSTSVSKTEPLEFHYLCFHNKILFNHEPAIIRVPTCLDGNQDRKILLTVKFP